MYKIGIVVVAYNRVNSLSRLLESITIANYDGEDRVDLIISIDKSNTDEVEVFADNFKWLFGNKIVDKHSQNLGLKKHMLSLGKWFEDYDAIIVLEDDIVVSPNYFSYTRQCVDKYYNEKEIAGISLYSFRTNYQNGLPFEPVYNGTDVYFMQCAMSWGEIWMKNQWNEFYNWYQNHQSFDISPSIPKALFYWGEKSWLKYHTRYCIEENKFFVHPYHSYTTNFSEVGENHKKTSGTNETVYQVPLVKGSLRPLVLCDLNNDEESIKYDGYFENINVIQHLKDYSEDICVDLYGLKKNNLNKRYILTTEVLNYRIIRSYAVSYKPMIENVFRDLAGEGIYLYDTTETVKNNATEFSAQIILYYYNITSITRFLINYKIAKILKAFFCSLSNRIK